MALDSDGVMLLAHGMVWGMLRERPVPLEVLEPDAWARGNDGLVESIPPHAIDSIPPPASDSIPPAAPRAHDNAFYPCSYLARMVCIGSYKMSMFSGSRMSRIRDLPKSEIPLCLVSGPGRA